MAGSASRVVFAIYAAGLENECAFVSDGQLSGLCNKGLTIAEVSPESDPRDVIGEITRLNMLQGGVLQIGQELSIPTQFTE